MTQITLDTAAGLEVGNRIRRASGGPAYVVTAIDGPNITVRPVRWWDDLPDWAVEAALLAVGGGLGYLVGLLWQ